MSWPPRRSPLGPPLGAPTSWFRSSLVAKAIWIAIGVVIRGETPHFDYVAGQAASGIAQAGLQTGIPVVFGVVTTDTVEQAINRSGVKSGNKGYEAAMSAVEIVNLYSEMAGRESEDKGKGQDKVFPHVV